MIQRSTNDWRPTAAYLYLLHLDAWALAWEYLRRNPAYRRDWNQRPQQATIAQTWGLKFIC